MCGVLVLLCLGLTALLVFSEIDRNRLKKRQQWIDSWTRRHPR